MMGRHPLGSLRRIDRKALHRTVKDLLDRLGVKLDPEQPVRGLSHRRSADRRDRQGALASTRAC